MKPCAALLMIATALAASVPSVCAQPRGHWSAFKKADGLAENACVSVTIGAGGNVLIRHLKLKSATEVLDLVGQYYPANRIPVKTQYLVEGLFEEGKV